MGRDSGASVALRPILIDGADEFVAEVSGSPNAVSIACKLLHEIMYDSYVEEPNRATADAASDVEEEFDMPRNYIPIVLGGRRSGDKGCGKSSGITELERKAGVRIEVMNDRDDPTLLLQIKGHPDNVAEVKHELTE